MGFIIIEKKELSHEMIVFRFNDDFIVGFKEYKHDTFLEAIKILSEVMTMKNRILLLCLKHHIINTKEYADIFNIDEHYAELIMRQEAPITNELLEKNCEYFNVSKAYILCEI